MNRSIAQVFFKLQLSSLSRSRRFLQQHQVSINGKRIFTPEYTVNKTDRLMVDDKEYEIPQEKYIMLNKPKGYVCSRKSESGMPVIYSLIDADCPELHSAGRLDADTTGLLLLTTDGSFSSYLVKPEFHIPKTYEIVLEKPVMDFEKEEYCRKCESGFFVPHEGKEKGFDAKPSELKWIDDETCLLTISEGKFHQVKRMMNVLSNSVKLLKRNAIGRLNLDENLSEGQWRYLTDEEISLLTLSPYKL